MQYDPSASSDRTDVWLPSWDAAAYAANTQHHRAHDAAFLVDFPARPADRVVDLGCGSGDFAAVVAGLVPEGHVIGVDPQPGLLDEARSRARANQSFARATAQGLDRVVGVATADGVVSRSALQWVPPDDHPAVLAAVARVLRPGGWFRLEMSGPGNIRLLLALLDDASATRGGPTSPWCFPDPGWYLERLEAAGLDAGAAPDGRPAGWIRALPQRRPFTRQSLLGWLRSQAYQAYELGLSDEAHQGFRDEVEGRLDEVRRHDGTLDQTFVRLDLLAYLPA